MKKTLYISLVIVALALIARYAPPPSFFHPPASVDAEYSRADMLLGNEKFDVLVADTEELKEKGLGGRTGLADREAMLFPYDKPASLPFWMKDMLFSIDIAWLDPDFRVIYLKKDASPDSYPETFAPSGYAQYVIEVSAGTLDRLGVRAGDIVPIAFRK